MIRYFSVSIASGITFGILDGIINANTIAQKLLAVYQPIAKTSVNATAGMIIDIGFGLIMGAIFLLLYKSLPGKTGWAKGISFGLMIWFFRVLMSAASTWMMFTVPLTTLLYLAAAGLLEMLIIGIIYGIFLKPVKVKLINKNETIHGK